MKKDINKEISEELSKIADEINETIKKGEKFIVNAKGESTKKIGTVLWDTAKAYGKLEGMEITVDVFRKHTGAKEAGTSDTQLYKQAGNAVTVNVIQAIGQELKEMERELEHEETTSNI